jgi:predicted ABC-type ATPase
VPQILIVAGPNGAGKTTFAEEYLGTETSDFAFVNADEIRRHLAEPPFASAQRDLYAGRLMLAQIKILVAARKNFMFETTLASLSYARKIPAWQQQGYRVALTYLRLPNVEMSLRRVRRRVAAGGHDIPEDVVRRRFDKSADYFQRVYKSIVDEWYVWDSHEDKFRLSESWITT